MVAASPEGRPAELFLGVSAARLSSARWLLAAVAALLLFLVLVNALAPAAGVVLFLAFAVLVAVLPRVQMGGGAGVSAAPSAGSAVESGVRAFANALPDPCFLLDRRGIVRYANAPAIAAFSIRQGDSLTFRLRNPDLVAAFDRVAHGAASERVEFVERFPTERWFGAWFANLAAAGGDAAGPIVLTIDDLSESRRTDRVRVDFVANASHELRTPLASLAGFIETLQGPARDDPQARGRFLSIMHEQATRMSRLVDDLLSLSRIEMKAHIRPADRVDLVAVSRHVVDSLEPLARELGVAIEADMPVKPVEVVGDRDELIQVIENLVENACKYGQPGKRVVVAVAAEGKGGGPAVSVRDFGPGIPDEHIPRLTERFYRVDADASRKHRGTGLGLAIVKHILARHQARMTIESRLGQGAEFAVAFPQAAVFAAAAEAEKSKLDQSLRLS
jgi:two-component system phosphate regulon sensor histidine kinase PhoR